MFFKNLFRKKEVDPEGIDEPLISEYEEFEVQNPLIQKINEAEVPDVPEAPDVPDVPEAPDVPDVPEAPDVPDVPEAPGVPDVPEAPDVPDVPEAPDVPDVPEAPDVPDVPNVPSPQFLERLQKHKQLMDIQKTNIQKSAKRLEQKVAERVRQEHENRQPVGTYMKFLDKLMNDGAVNEEFRFACKEYKGKEYTPSYDPCRYAMHHKRADIFAYAMGNGIPVTPDIYVLPIQENYIEGLKMLCDMNVPFPVVETTPLNLKAIRYLISRGLKPDAMARMLILN